MRILTRTLFITILLALVAAVATLSYRNAAAITVDVFGLLYTAPIALMLGIAVVGGSLTCLFCMLPLLWRQRRRVRQAEKLANELQQELDHLRKLPFEDT